MAKRGNLESKFLKRIKNKVTLEMQTGLFKGQYISDLEDIREGLLALAHPMYKGGLLRLYRGVTLEVTVEGDPTPLRVKAEVVRSDLSGNLPLLWVRPVGEVEKHQRRAFVRVPCLMKSRFYNLSREDEKPLSGSWKEGKVLDISLGGMRLQHKSHGKTDGIFQKEEMGLFTLNIEESPFLVLGRAMWVPQPNEEGMQDVGVAFTVVPVAVSKRLQQYIRQQELLAGGRGSS
ncbi:MAG: PilZ domain-containing protein [Synergistales bacterium]|nr:PilZ domain-containing protein [Synergistales bacterium]